MEKELRPPDDDILKLCRLTYMLIEELADKDKKEEYNKTVDKVIKEINDQKTQTKAISNNNEIFRIEEES